MERPLFLSYAFYFKKKTNLKLGFDFVNYIISEIGHTPGLNTVLSMDQVLNKDPLSK